jgi:hypothetical protein
MFLGDDQHAVGLRDLVLKAHHLGRQMTFIVLVVHRQVIDARECRFEFAGAEPHQRLSELAVDGVPAIVADNHGDAGQNCVTGHVEYLSDKL